MMSSIQYLLGVGIFAREDGGILLFLYSLYILQENDMRLIPVGLDRLMMVRATYVKYIPP